MSFPRLWDTLLKGNLKTPVQSVEHNAQIPRDSIIFSEGCGELSCIIRSLLLEAGLWALVAECGGLVGGGVYRATIIYMGVSCQTGISLCASRPC